MTWRIAPALDTLHAEINAAAPTRAKASDGGIGDAKHSARASDHNPCDCCRIVCARDWTNDPPTFDAQRLADWLQGRALAGDKRIKYVIWHHRIMSGPGQSHPCGVWRPYTGKNPHTKHLHLSIAHDHADDDAPWGWPPAAAA